MMTMVLVLQMMGRGSVGDDDDESDESGPLTYI